MQIFKPCISILLLCPFGLLGMAEQIGPKEQALASIKLMLKSKDLASIYKNENKECITYSLTLEGNSEVIATQYKYSSKPCCCMIRRDEINGLSCPEVKELPDCFGLLEYSYKAQQRLHFKK